MTAGESLRQLLPIAYGGGVVSAGRDGRKRFLCDRYLSDFSATKKLGASFSPTPIFAYSLLLSTVGDRVPTAAGKGGGAKKWPRELRRPHGHFATCECTV